MHDNAISLDLVVWVFDTVYNQLRTKNDFTRYEKENCWQCSDLHFSIKYIPNHGFVCKIHIGRMLLTSASKSRLKPNILPLHVYAFYTYIRKVDLFLF